MSSLILNCSSNAYVSASNPTTHYPDTGTLYCGRYTNAQDIYRSLLKFNMLPLPVNCIINSAYLKLYIKRNDVPNLTKPTKLYKLLNDFDENTVSYSTVPSFDPTPLATLNITSQLNTYIQWDITSILSQWKLFPQQNFGLLVEGLENQYSLTTFGSRMHSSPNTQPVIEVNYELTQDIVAYDEETLEFLGDNESITSMVIPLGPNVATFGIKNEGPGTVSAVIEISNDMNTWINNNFIYGSPFILGPDETATLTSIGYMNYARLKFIHYQVANVNNLDIEDATIKIYKTLRY
ncbi:DNRLRE domain-containing protein [Clostridium sp. MB40-C1]|uniref:DNRLRE domain-containing protein n=1 Tax=Clostridium sp. MB40-C1 TaxID=3070996 RepID=UPI0027E04542|nr:DNRLRE domain-containing protein [Clostridium sp. MB40-C1]WMJ81128.1 DNRLRE domain-containing protein [Clostridium sp. MB40-C1]